MKMLKFPALALLATLAGLLLFGGIAWAEEKYLWMNGTDSTPAGRFTVDLTVPPGSGGGFFLLANGTADCKVSIQRRPASENRYFTVDTFDFNGTTSGAMRNMTIDNGGRYRVGVEQGSWLGAVTGVLELFFGEK